MISRRDALKLGAAGLIIPALERAVPSPLQAVSARQGNANGSVPTFRGNTARTGEMPGPGPSLGRPVEVRWKFLTDGWVTSTPSVAYGTVYVGSQDNSLYALDATTGHLIWDFATDGYIVSSPAMANGTVYVGGQNGNVYALNAGTGAEQWQVATGNFIRSSPAVVDDVVYIGSGDTNLYALDAATGAERWRFPTGDWITSSPAVVDGRVYIISQDGYLYAIDAATGGAIWQAYVGDGGNSVPALSEGMVFFGGQDNHLLALDMSDGSERWRFATGGAVLSAPAVGNGTVYIGSNDHNLYAVDAYSGNERWRFPTEHVVQQPPAVTDDTVYIGGNDSILYAIDTSNGSERWRFAAEMFFASSTTVVNGFVYIGNGDGHIYAFGNMGQDEPDDDATPAADAVLSADVVIRGAPSNSGVERGTAQAGDTITSVGERDSRFGEVWMLVTVNGTTGWIPENAVSFSASTQASTPSATAVEQAPAVDTSETGLTSLLPDPGIVPAGFDGGTDSTSDFATVVGAIGGNRQAEQNLTDWGWTANVSRAFNNTAPTDGSTDALLASLHGFKDAPSAAAALNFYADYLATAGATDVEAPALGESARMLSSTDEAGNISVSLYVQDGPVLYRFWGVASAGGDLTQAVIDFATQTLGS